MSQHWNAIAVRFPSLNDSNDERRIYQGEEDGEDVEGRQDTIGLIGLNEPDADVGACRDLRERA
jgi:hypothetical protein